MTNTERQDPTPLSDSQGHAQLPAESMTVPGAVDPEDPGVVPAALAALVAAARQANAVIEVNGHYRAGLAIAAIEDVVAAVVRICTSVTPYAGDVSSAGGRAMTRAEELLGEARVALSDARHHVCLDEARHE